MFHSSIRAKTTGVQNKSGEYCCTSNQYVQDQSIPYFKKAMVHYSEKLRYSPWGTMHDKKHTMCHRIQQLLIYLQLDLKHLKILELNECQSYLRHSFPTILVDQFQQQLHLPDVQ